MLIIKKKALSIIPPELCSYINFKNARFFFFGLNGWFLKTQSKNLSFIFNKLANVIRFFFSSTHIFTNFIFGLIKIHFKYLQLRGRNFRFLFTQAYLILKFGYSHKIYYAIPNNICINLINKQVLQISGPSLFALKTLFFDLHLIRKFDKYKGKGLLYYKDSIVFKISSKKTKV